MSRSTLQPAAVCVLDVRDARALWRDRRDAMREAIAALEEAFSHLLDAHGGETLTTARDDFVARFDDVSRAADWALDLQERLAELDRSTETDEPDDDRALLQVAIGVDIGVVGEETAARTGRRLASGPVIASAAEVARRAPAGTIALSPVAQDLIEDVVREETPSAVAERLRPRLHSYQEVQLLVPQSSQSNFPQLAPRPRTSRANLPVFSGKFIDRVREFDALARVFETPTTDDQTGFVVICGSAGAGKSRLAVEFTNHWLAFHEDEGAQAWFCDLSEVDALDEALFSVARTTGVQIPASETVEALDEALSRAFGARGPLMLILDDVDRLGADFDASIARWLGEAPNLGVLATCKRQPVDDAGAQVVSVEPLGNASATALLEDRLRHPVGISEKPGDPERLARIVAKSGRLPLALELLAGTVRHDSAPRRRAEGGSTGNAPSELDEAITQSWDLLDELEQIALMACTVFVGNFTEQAAIALIGAVIADSGTAGPSDTDASEANKLLDSLRHSSLVRADGRVASASSGRQTRLILLAPVRDFVATRADDAVVEAARLEHLAYFATWAADLKDALRSDREHVWIRRAEAELANLYRAVDFGQRHDLVHCLSILEGLSELDTRIGPLGGFSERADLAVEAARQLDDADLLMRALLLRAKRLLWTGQYSAAEQDYREAQPLAEALEDPLRIAITHCHVGFAMGMCGHEEQALVRVREAAQMVRDLEAFEVISVLSCAAVIARNQHRVDEALDYHHRALVRARRLDNTFGQASALCLLGATLRQDQQWQEAIRCLEEALEMFLSIGDRRGCLVAYYVLGACYNDTEQDESAERCYREAMALASDIGDHEYSGLFFLGRGRSRFRRGEYARAEPDLLEASIAVDEAGHIHLKIAAKMYLAATYAALERVAEARTYFERVDQIFVDTEVTGARPTFEVLHGYLDAACARVAYRNDDEPEALRMLQSAYERADLDADAEASLTRDTRCEAQRLQAYLDRRVLAGELPAGADASRALLKVCRDMRWFSVGDAEPVDISRRGAIRRILRALVEKRIDHPNTPMDVHELLEAGWPDEATVAQSGQQRTYMAISRLRGLGLSEVLETVDDGYLIDTAYTPVWVTRSESSD